MRAALTALLLVLLAPAAAADEIPVLKARAQAGDVIAASDLDWKEVRPAQVGRNIATGAGELVGMAAKRSISPGVPVRVTDLEPPQLVRKGALVTMSVEFPGLMLSATGRAIDSGAEGDTIQVMNTQSRRTVPATVTGPNRVTVQSRARIL